MGVFAVAINPSAGEGEADFLFLHVKLAVMTDIVAKVGTSLQTRSFRIQIVHYKN
jgi:hypothetical protein